mgnify:CR=1 FL=1
MADSKISALSTLATSAIAAGDLIPIVDVSDTSMSGSGTNKVIDANKVAYTNIANTFTANQNITGTLNITSTLGVDGLATLGGGVRSGIISSIATNSVATISGASGALHLYAYTSGGTPVGIVTSSTGGVVTIIAQSSTALAVVNDTVLTGTTGSTDKVTVSWKNNVWYVENRLAYAVSYRYLLLV